MRTVVLMLLLLLPAVVCAQEFGTIRGKMTDRETGEPLIGANVIVYSTPNRGAATDVNGAYVILNVPPGRHKVTGSYIGYKARTIEDVVVMADSVTICDITVEADAYRSEEVCIVAERPLIERSMSMNYMIRGSRADAAGYEVGGATPNVPRNCLGEWNTEEYASMRENGFRPVESAPLSTFSIDVDNASYANVRRFLMQDRLPPKDAVRVEECINYFDYGYPPPEPGTHPMTLHIGYTVCPWNTAHQLVRIALKGKILESDERPPCNLVFLIDVSGSMSSENKLPLLKRAFGVLVDKLRPEDRVAIVVYAGSAGCVLPSTPARDRETILEAIDRLRSGGSTAGGAGIALAYQTAMENFIEHGNNRVILATDGDFNVGVSNTSELVEMIEGYRDKNIFLTALGFGFGNYKDSRLQDLADKGNGNHYYIDDIMEARKVFGYEMLGTIFTIAKDVKIQVEFNPAHVASWRLVGYENRLLNDEDFEDDRKDAGEMGAGHTVTALYEVIPAGSGDGPSVRPLRYQDRNLKGGDGLAGEVLTVHVRYKDVEENESVEFSKILDTSPVEFAHADDALRLAASVTEFAMLLRDSEYKGDASFDHALATVEGISLPDPHASRAELITLLHRAKVVVSERLGSAR